MGDNSHFADEREAANVLGAPIAVIREAVETNQLPGFCLPNGAAYVSREGLERARIEIAFEAERQKAIASSIDIRMQPPTPLGAKNTMAESNLAYQRMTNAALASRGLLTPADRAEEQRLRRIARTEEDQRDGPVGLVDTRPRDEMGHLIAPEPPKRGGRTR